MRRRADVLRALALALGMAFGALAAWPSAARAQEQQESPEVMRALELENAGKYREAAQVYRGALAANPTASAVLGLERAYAELGMSDSLLAPVDSAIAKRPRDAIYRTVQMRTLQILRREEPLRAAFERWVHDAPHDNAPYREYARLLIDLGRPAQADSIVQRSGRLFGSVRDLAFETAQLRAAQGQWEQSAQAWRIALQDRPELAMAAAYALTPAPSAVRATLRAVLLPAARSPGVAQALASLALRWGDPEGAWSILRALAPDTASARVWSEFAEEAETQERFALARDALVKAIGVERTPELVRRAASDALHAGTPAAALEIAPVSELARDPQRGARELLPIQVEALAALGRAGEAQTLVERYDTYLPPGLRARLSRTIANGWVRAGDLPRANAALRDAGAEGDSSDAAGWLALYSGNVAAARVLLAKSREPGPELALALGVLSRLRADTAPELGAAFLALARRDSVAASAHFVDASVRHAEIASVLLLEAARISAARGDSTGALALWTRIVAEHGDRPEAAEAELEWARSLRRSGNATAAVAHLEHLILSAPQSALLPQARRELDLARAAVPGH